MIPTSASATRWATGKLIQESAGVAGGVRARLSCFLALHIFVFVGARLACCGSALCT